MAGWIKLHRKILDNPIFFKPELYQLFSYCLLRANHNESKIIWNGEEETLEKGCFLTGRKAIAQDTRQNESSVYKRLKNLEKLNMISVKSNNKFSVVKVLNYCIYQGEETDKEQQSNNKVTTREQQSNTDKNLRSKELKNDKKINISSKVFADDSPELNLTLNLLNLIRQNNPKTKEPSLQSWAKEFNLILRVDNREVADVMSVMEWSQKDNFWKGNILSPSSLRKQFDKLTVQMRSRGGGVSQPQVRDPAQAGKYDNFYL